MIGLKVGEFQPNFPIDYKSWKAQTDLHLTKSIDDKCDVENDVEKRNHNKHVKINKTKLTFMARRMLFNATNSERVGYFGRIFGRAS